MDVVARLRRVLPYVADPAPVTKRYTRTREGLSEREAIRFLIMSDELHAMKQEEQDEHLRRLRQSNATEQLGGATQSGRGGR